jgi:hypothetical protein
MPLTNLTIERAPLLSVPYRFVNERGRPAVGILEVSGGHVDGLPTDVHAILATADLQGLEVAGPRLLGEVLAEELVLAAFDGILPDPSSIGVLLAGDLSCRPDLDRRGGAGDVIPVWRAFAEHFRWVVGVAGNHDLFGGGATLKNLELTRKKIGVDILHDEVVERDGLRIAGFCGIVGTNGRPWRTPPEAFCEALSGLMARDPDVLLLHEGPAGDGPRQPGNNVIRASLADSSRTGMVICGHSHWDAPHARITRGLDVLNVDFRCILLKGRHPC